MSSWTERPSCRWYDLRTSSADAASRKLDCVVAGMRAKVPKLHQKFLAFIYCADKHADTTPFRHQFTFHFLASNPRLIATTRLLASHLIKQAQTYLHSCPSRPQTASSFQACRTWGSAHPLIHVNGRTQHSRQHHVPYPLDIPRFITTTCLLFHACKTGIPCIEISIPCTCTHMNHTAIADPFSSAMGFTVSFAPITKVTSVSLKSSLISSISSTTDASINPSSLHRLQSEVKYCHMARKLQRVAHYTVPACALPLDGSQTTRCHYRMKRIAYMRDHSLEH